MPIPQLEKKRSTKPEHARDASAIRKKRAAERQGKNPRASVGQFQKVHTGSKPAGSSGAAEKSATSKQAAAGKGKGKGKKKPQKSWKKRLLKAVGAMTLAGVGLAIVAGGVVYAWASKDLASITDIEKRSIPQATKIYARDGETLLYEIGDNKRQDVTMDQIADELEWATVALEDKYFFEHGGVSLTGITRAALANVFNLDTGQGGASTLTQQFIKNSILTPERTYTRKIKEAILSMRLEQKYSKDEILNMYMNEVYYGANYQGVEVAAQGFFGKSAAEVNLAEAATLAALPQNPPLLMNDPDRLKARRDYTLDLMVDLGYITETDAAAAKQITLHIQDEITAINAPHFVFYIRSYLEDKYGQTAVRKGGMNVTTTLDWDKQQKAEQAITTGVTKVEQYGGSNAALVSIDTHTGQILAMVGSRDYFDDEHDGQVNVTTSLRQPGSSFKPIVYLTAFTKGYTPDTKLFDIETDFPTDAEGKYHPRNYDLGQRGPVTIRYALGQSLNIPAVKALYLVGVNTALDVAEQLGYTSFGDRSRFGLALVLGGGEVTLLEHTAAFATFAREGEYHKPVAVLSVKDSSGDVLEEWEDNPYQVIDHLAVRTLNSVLSDSGARSGFTELNLSDRASAAKTGTTNDYRDAWTIGYTPSVATGVWAGNNDNSEMARGAAGLVIAAPIWNAYMESVLSGTPAESFNEAAYTSPSSVLGGNLEITKNAAVDSITGELIPEECVGDYPSKYIEQKEFKEAHTILYYIDKDDPTGSPPSNPRDDPMFEAWETAVMRWAQSDTRKSEYLTDATPQASCNMRNEDQQPTVTVTTPTAGTEYNKSNFAFAARAKPGDGRIVTSVEFYIDVTLVETQSVNLPSAGNVYSSYKPKNLTKGRHDALVRVWDDKGNVGESTVRFEYDD
ncbi:transglycosylase domain-containing protein [Patescibacteria group bacterium]